MEAEKQPEANDSYIDYLKEFLPALAWEEMDDDDYETVKKYYRDVHSFINDNLLTEVETQKVNFRERLMKVAYDSFKEGLVCEREIIELDNAELREKISSNVLKLMKNVRKFEKIILYLGLPVFWIMSLWDKAIELIFFTTLGVGLVFKISTYRGQKKLNSLKNKFDDDLRNFHKMNVDLLADESSFRYLFNKIFIRELDKLGIPKNEQEEMFEGVMKSFKKAVADLEVN